MMFIGKASSIDWFDADFYCCKMKDLKFIIGWEEYCKNIGEEIHTRSSYVNS